MATNEERKNETWHGGKEKKREPFVFMRYARAHTDSKQYGNNTAAPNFKFNRSLHNLISMCSCLFYCSCDVEVDDYYFFLHSFVLRWSVRFVQVSALLFYLWSERNRKVKHSHLKRQKQLALLMKLIRLDWIGRNK